VLEVLLNTATAPLVAEHLFAPGETLHAPQLLGLEVVQVLRRYERSGDLDSTRGLQALEDLADLPLIHYPHDIFLSRIWQLRHNATAYDAAYLALAEALGASLVTRDGGIATVPGHRARVILL